MSVAFRHVLTGSACLLITGCASKAEAAPQPVPVAAVASAPAPAPQAHEDVRALLAAQVAAWNRHDLDGFLAGYRQDDHVVFVTREGTSRGFSELQQRYRKTYNAPEAFGELRFDGIECATVDADAVLVQGAWRLIREKDSPHGRFVLVVCRLPEGWRIVSDFTTVDSSGD